MTIDTHAQRLFKELTRGSIMHWLVHYTYSLMYNVHYTYSLMYTYSYQEEDADGSYF